MTNLSVFTAVLLVTVFFGGFLGLGLAYTAWQRRGQRGAMAFVLYSLSYSAWMFGAGVLWLSPWRSVSLLFDLFTELAGTATLLAWVLFVITYTQQRDRFLGWRRAVVIAYVVVYLLRVALVALLWVAGTPPATEHYQGLTVVAAQTAVEPYGYGAVTVIGGLGILFWTFYVLWQYSRSEISGQRQQARVILFTGMVPTIGYIGYVAANITLHEHLDPTPLLFTVTVVGTWFALFVYDFLEIEPVAANSLFETMDDPVLIVDEELHVLTANESAQRLPISAGDRVPDPIAAAINSQEMVASLESKSGDERVFDVSVSMLADGNRRLVVLRDITIRTRRERELERQNQRLDEFASVVSHDLRNPLSVASGTLTLLEETGELDKTTAIRKSHERMETIIDELLRMARSGKTIEETEPVELQAVATQAFQQVPTEDVDVSIDTDISATIEADRNKLLQLFENLFRNAVKHGPTDSQQGDAVEGGSTGTQTPSSETNKNDEPSLSVRVVAVTDGGSPVGFAVEDTGRGIPPEEREQIFDYGYTNSAGGTGFGLSIVENIATAHGWTVAATESEDGGARFEITGCQVVTDTTE